MLSCDPATTQRRARWGSRTQAGGAGGGREGGWPASPVLSDWALPPPTGKEPRDESLTSTSRPML